MATSNAEAFRRLANPPFMLDTYPDLETDADRRKYITSILKKTNFMVNVTPISNTEYFNLTQGGVTPFAFSGAAVHTGMVWVNCYVDGTDLTGSIVTGKPVVFDTVTGRGVTGIHPSWKTDEYKIVGTAWKPFTGPGWGRIPISLHAPNPEVKPEAAKPLVRFQLTENLEPGMTANAKVITYDPTSDDYELTAEIVTVKDFTEEPGMFRGKSGFQGWATPVDDEEYLNVVYLEPQALFIQFETLAEFQANSAPASVVRYWNGNDPGTTLDNIYDETGISNGKASGFKGVAAYDWIEDKYRVLPQGKSGGTAPVRFELYEELVYGQPAGARLVIYDGANWVAEEESLILVEDFTRNPGSFRGKIGYRGWALSMDDSGVYEILFMERKARFIEFTLTQDMQLNGSATANLLGSNGDWWDGKDPGSNTTVYDDRGLFLHAMSGAKGMAVWDDKADHYIIIECQTKAGWLKFLTVGDFASDPPTAPPKAQSSILQYGGTQQDIQNPGTTNDIYDLSGYGTGLPLGTFGMAILDSIADRYFAIPYIHIVFANIRWGGANEQHSVGGGLHTIYYSGALNSINSTSYITRHETQSAGGKITIHKHGYLIVMAVGHLTADQSVATGQYDVYNVGLKQGLNGTSAGAVIQNANVRIPLDDLSHATTFCFCHTLITPPTSLPLDLSLRISNLSSSERTVKIGIDTSLYVTWIGRK